MSESELFDFLCGTVHIPKHIFEGKMSNQKPALTPLTKEQAAVIGAYTGILCGNFSDMAEYCERLLNRPIFTHEYPSLREQIKEASRNDFISICNKDKE